MSKNSKNRWYNERRMIKGKKCMTVYALEVLVTSRQGTEPIAGLVSDSPLRRYALKVSLTPAMAESGRLEELQHRSANT
jgi:hypothetical protein